MISKTHFNTAVLLGVVALVGCQQQLMRTPNLYLNGGTDPWKATPAELRTNTVDVIYATDRAELTEDPLTFGFRRSQSLSFGKCIVTLGAELGFEELRRQSLLVDRTKSVPVELTDTVGIGRYPKTPWSWRETEQGVPINEDDSACRETDDKLRHLIATALAKTTAKRAFIYVHGFNNDFQAAAIVAAQLWHFCGREGVPIIYTWPAGSGVNIRGYNEDRESGEFTNFHLKAFIEAVAATPGLERLDLIAHSRGTAVLTTALRELHIKYTAAAGGDMRATARNLKLGNVILAAPDIDNQVALQCLAAERLDLACKRLTIYMSSTDLAIRISRWLFRSMVRVGTLCLYDPPEDDRERQLADIPGIDLIDARVTSDFVGHAYFYSNPAASSDLILLLRYNLDPGVENGRPLTREKSRFWILTDDYAPSLN